MPKATAVFDADASRLSMRRNVIVIANEARRDVFRRAASRGTIMIEISGHGEPAQFLAAGRWRDDGDRQGADSAGCGADGFARTARARL